MRSPVSAKKNRVSSLMETKALNLAMWALVLPGLPPCTPSSMLRARTRLQQRGKRCFFRRPRTLSAQPRATLKWGFEGALRVGDGYLLGAHQTRVVFLKRCFFRRHRNKTLVDYFCCKLAGSLRLSSRLIGPHVTPYTPCSSLPSQSVYLYIYAHIYSLTHACMCVIYV